MDTLDKLQRAEPIRKPEAERRRLRREQGLDEDDEEAEEPA
jgi:hypothetical protein